MSSPLFQTFGQSDFVTKFNQFKRSFQGNPQEQVQQLLNSGKISQAQLNQAMQIANQLKQVLPR